MLGYTQTEKGVVLAPIRWKGGYMFLALFWIYMKQKEMALSRSQSGSFWAPFNTLTYSKALKPQMAPFMAPFGSQNASLEVLYWIFFI